ncbi:hypothetical protein GA0115253_1033034 [Streptomyces sp. Termitarium-T10T-6]|nr:hypothetical protein GA0115253_1033034 [Streptomyces sp. Termitarium-T10T-6]
MVGRQPGRFAVGQSSGDSPLTTRSANSAAVCGDRNAVAAGVSSTVQVTSRRARRAPRYDGNDGVAMEPVAATSMRFPLEGEGIGFSMAKG